jgi:hypothetical protein
MLSLKVHNYFKKNIKKIYGETTIEDRDQRRIKWSINLFTSLAEDDLQKTAANTILAFL